MTSIVHSLAAGSPVHATSNEGYQADQPKAQLFEWDCKRLEKLLTIHDELLKEKFFLENNGNMVDFAAWKRKPNTILDKYLKKHCLDPAMFSQPVAESNELRKKGLWSASRLPKVCCTCVQIHVVI